MARRAHRSSILSSSRTPDQLRVPRSEHLVHFSRRRCFEHNQRPEHLTCRRPRLDVARRAHPWPGTWCTYRRSQYERYSLAVTSDGKVGPSGVVLRPLSGPGGDNVVWCCAAARAGSVCGRTPVTMFAYAHAKWCVLRVVSNAYTTDSRQHIRLGRPKRQPANSTAEEEKPPPKSAPARKKAVEVLGCAARDERVRRTSRKRPRPSRAPQEVTRKTLRRAQTGRVSVRRNKWIRGC